MGEVTEMWMVLAYDKVPEDAVVRYGPFVTFERALLAAKGSVEAGTYARAGIFRMTLQVEHWRGEDDGGEGSP